jgi:hypothetical protein
MTDFNPDDENDLAQVIPDEDDIVEAEEPSDLIEDSEDEEDDNPDLSEESLKIKNVSKVSNVQSDSEEDENELVLPDDAEEDLLTILESKINSELAEQEEQEVQTSSDDSQEFLIMPKRVDEQHCQRCWLLVRKGAPKCPVHDDDCPIFSSAAG